MNGLAVFIGMKIEARRKAAYGGMTPEETTEYESRQRLISVLAEKLLLLGRPKQGQ